MSIFVMFFIAGRIPNGMQVTYMDTFSTERYSLTGIWSFLSYSYSII